MLKQLKDALDGYCSTYFDYEHSEAEIDSRRNVTPEGSVFNLKAQYANSLAFVIAQSHVQNVAKALESVRDINPSVPFDAALLVNLSRASMPFHATKFAKAVSECREGLRRLASWVKLLPPTSELPKEVHGVTVAMIESARKIARQNIRISATLLTNKLGNRKTANLSLRVLETLGEYSGFQRRPTPKIAAEVSSIIQQLNLRTGPQ
jgi:hypothetical protein